MFKTADLSEGSAEPRQHRPFVAAGFHFSNIGSDRSQLRKLNARVHPGLRPWEFNNLLHQCGTCCLIMTKQAFLRHDCPEVIDLTKDEAIDLTTESDTEVED